MFYSSRAPKCTKRLYIQCEFNRITRCPPVLLFSNFPIFLPAFRSLYPSPSLSYFLLIISSSYLSILLTLCPLFSIFTSSYLPMLVCFSFHNSLSPVMIFLSFPLQLSQLQYIVNSMFQTFNLQRNP